MDGRAGGHCDHPEWTMVVSQLKLSSSLSSVIQPFLCLDKFYFFPPEQCKPGKMRQYYIYNGQSLQYRVILVLWNCGSKQATY